jgi:hypothetical protein
VPGSVVPSPEALLLLGAIPRFEGFEWHDLVRQDDGSLALQVITAFAWITWAWFAVTILLEAVARVRGVRAPRLPGRACCGPVRSSKPRPLGRA